MKAYSRIKRLAVLAARDAGKSAKEVADRFSVSESWVRRVVQQRRELGKLGPYKYRFRDRRTASLWWRIRYTVVEDPRITVKELERALGTKLSIDDLQGIKDELDINWDVVWYGGLSTQFILSPTGNYTTEPRGPVLDRDIENEIKRWKWLLPPTALPIPKPDRGGYSIDTSKYHML
jgi:transposase